MRIGRKEAILALVASVIPFMGRKGNAQLPNRVPPSTLRAPLVQAPDLADLQRRIAALEAQLANQVAFTKDPYGNLKLHVDRDVTIEAGANFTVKANSTMSLRAGATGEFSASGTTTIKGAMLALN